jgi:hypothetical protein
MTRSIHPNREQPREVRVSINFLVNDPAVPGAQAKVVQASANRPASKATFSISQLPAEQKYQVGTNEFVVWQAREAALRTLNIFEAIAGPLVGWTGKASKKKLALRPNDGQDLNAYYDRASVSFFEFAIGQRKIFSGASTDVVAHEVGHAILDALRPDLWDAQMFEVPAFHEGFGDCMALMTALSDRATRVELLHKSANLSAANFVEATAEELSFGIFKAISPNHNAAKPRRALNSFQWTLPQSLPPDGKPGVLINEIHSFGQLTSGCYYELIREIFLAGQGGEAALGRACATATKLLALAVKAAPIKARFLESVGRTMILVDRNQNNGRNETHIRNAFQRHGIALTVTTFLARRMALEGPQPSGKGKGRKGAVATLTAPARRMLHSVFEVGPQARLETRAFAPAREATEVVTYRAVDLTGLSERLRNVKAYTPLSALVGSERGAAAVLGAVDSGVIVSNEVRSFVETLVRHGLIDFDGTPKKKAAKPKKKKARKGAGVVSGKNQPTHVIRNVGGEKVIERIGFACGCHPARWRCVSA